MGVDPFACVFGRREKDLDTVSAIIVGGCFFGNEGVIFWCFEISFDLYLVHVCSVVVLNYLIGLSKIL